MISGSLHITAQFPDVGSIGWATLAYYSVLHRPCMGAHESNHGVCKRLHEVTVLISSHLQHFINTRSLDQNSHMTVPLLYSSIPALTDGTIQQTSYTLKIASSNKVSIGHNYSFLKSVKSTVFLFTLIHDMSLTHDALCAHPPK